MLWACVWEDSWLPFRLSACTPVCLNLSESWQYSVSAGQKSIFESNSKPQALFLGISKIFCTWWLSPHCFFSLNIGTFSVILYKGFRSNFIKFGAGIIFGNMSVSDRRAEMPIHKFKTISNCPNQGSLSVALTNASVLGRCYIVRLQPAASVAICACAWEKKE